MPQELDIATHPPLEETAASFKFARGSEHGMNLDKPLTRSLSVWLAQCPADSMCSGTAQYLNHTENQVFHICICLIKSHLLHQIIDGHALLSFSLAESPSD